MRNLIDHMKETAKNPYVKRTDPPELRRIMFDHKLSEGFRKYELVVPCEVQTLLRPSLERLIVALIAPETRPALED